MADIDASRTPRGRRLGQPLGEANERVAPPGPPDGWEARFATDDAAKGWVDLVATARSNTWEAFIVLTTRPTEPENRARQHRLKGTLGSHEVHGRSLEQWQYESPPADASGTARTPTRASSGSSPREPETRRPPTEVRCYAWPGALCNGSPSRRSILLSNVDAGQPLTLPLTGERTTPHIEIENYWFRRHEVVYDALAPACRDAVVLDAGVGEGYGAAALADVARRVIACELDPATAAHVARRYPAPATVRADLQHLPLASGAVDVVVTLQVVEHLHDQPGFLAECARVLRPGGRLFCATPNRLTFSPGAGPDDTPLNPFHTRELDAGGLRTLVDGAGLRVDRLDGLHHGPALRERDARHGGSVVDAQIALAVSGEPWPVALRADVAAITVDEFALRDDDLDASLDLLVSATRPPR